VFLSARLFGWFPFLRVYYTSKVKESQSQRKSKNDPVFRFWAVLAAKGGVFSRNRVFLPSIFDFDYL